MDPSYKPPNFVGQSNVSNDGYRFPNKLDKGRRKAEGARRANLYHIYSYTLKVTTSPLQIQTRTLSWSLTRRMLLR